MKENEKLKWMLATKMPEDAITINELLNK